MGRIEVIFFGGRAQQSALQSKLTDLISMLTHWPPAISYTLRFDRESDSLA